MLICLLVASCSSSGGGVRLMPGQNPAARPGEKPSKDEKPQIIKLPAVKKDVEEVAYSEYLQWRQQDKIVAEESKDGYVSFSVMSEQNVAIDGKNNAHIKVIEKKKAKLPAEKTAKP